MSLEREYRFPLLERLFFHCPGLPFEGLQPHIQRRLEGHGSREQHLERSKDWPGMHGLFTEGAFLPVEQAFGGEGEIVPVYDVLGLFQAKALILEESHPELAKYLDVSITKVGNLYYMLNLIATLKTNP